MLRKHLRGKASAAIAAAAGIDFGPVDLPGPTGEANTLTLYPRGCVLCLGPDGDTLLAQAVQALAAGNSVLAVAPGAPAALQSLLGKGLPIAAIDGSADPVESRSLGGRCRGVFGAAGRGAQVAGDAGGAARAHRPAGERGALSGCLCA